MTSLQSGCEDRIHKLRTKDHMGPPLQPCLLNKWSTHQTTEARARSDQAWARRRTVMAGPGCSSPPCGSVDALETLVLQETGAQGHSVFPDDFITAHRMARALPFLQKHTVPTWLLRAESRHLESRAACSPQGRPCCCPHDPSSPTDLGSRLHLTSHPSRNTTWHCRIDLPQSPNSRGIPP